MKFCFLFIFLFSFSTMAGFHAPISPVVRDGNSVGNGGGVICIKGKCQTLIEAGLKLSPEYDGIWIPDADHFQMVEDIIVKNTALPTSVQEKFYLQIFGRSDHFRRVEVVDPAKLESIKKQYQAVADEANFEMDPETFAVVAFSSDDTVTPAMTYLLPGFFELESRQQANLLIHEGLYRGKPSSHLRYVLQFESSISEFESWANAHPHTTSCNPGLPKFLKVCNNQQFLSRHLGLMTNGEIIGTIFSLSEHGMEKRMESPVTFVPIEKIGKLEAEVLTFDPSKLLAFAKYEPRIPYLFSKVESVTVKHIDDESLPVSTTPGGHSLQINWDQVNPGIIINCPHATAGYRNCRIYAIQASDTIPLLLPK